MATYYNATQCINIKEKYNEFDIAEWLIKMPTGRQLKAGSLRVNGFLKVKKTKKCRIFCNNQGLESDPSY